MTLPKRPLAPLPKKLAPLKRVQKEMVEPDIDGLAARHALILKAVRDVLEEHTAADGSHSHVQHSTWEIAKKKWDRLRELVREGR